MTLNKDSRNLFNAENLKKVKKGSILINTARDPIVNEADLVDSLKSGHLQAYLADVSEQEPPRKGSPLFELDNVLFTPHIAWASKESRKRLIEATVQNVQAIIAGEPVNVVN